MPKVIFIPQEGGRIEVDARIGETVMLAALVGMVPGIEAECGGACSCGTCQIIVGDEWRALTGTPDTLEAGMLAAIEARPGCRLSCQIKLHEALDGLLVHVPANP